MTSFSVVIPYRAADSVRADNLAAVVSWYRAHFSDTELIVVEHPEPDHPATTNEAVAARWLTIDPAPLFNKSRCINAGVSACQHELVMVSDADMLVPAETIDRSLSGLQSGLDMVRPYERLIDLTEPQRDRFMTTGALPEVPDKTRGFNRNWTGEQLCVAGGVFLIRAAFFVELGGFDSRFEGWGGEDDAFSIKAETLSSRTVVSRDTVAWHLWHLRSRSNNDESYRRNNSLLNALRSLDAVGMRTVVEHQREMLLSEYGTG